MIKVITNLMNLPNAGQPVCSQPKHTHQQHQYSCSIFNVVVQFASNPTQSEQPDHLQRAEQTAYALKTDRKAEMWVGDPKSAFNLSLNTVVLQKIDYMRIEHAFTHQTPRAHSFYMKNANAEPDSKQDQLQPLFIDALRMQP